MPSHKNTKPKQSPSQGKLTTDQFIILYSDAFPEFEDEIFDNDYRESIYLQVGLLIGHINHSIKNGILKEVKRVFTFFEQMMPQVNAEVENALVVSFLEHIKMDGDSENEIAARKLLAPQYLQLWKSLREVMLPPKASPGKTKSKRRR